MYYILAPFIRLTGYQKLPFAVFNMKTGRTDFMNREKFRLVSNCDGSTDIVPDALGDDLRPFFDSLLENGYILPCEKGARKLRADQEYVYYDNRYRETLFWSVTGRCNYRCKHCFMSAPEAKFGHPSKEQCLDLIRQAAECGISNVAITGGEPLVRDDFMELVDAMTQHGLPISTILTNGALVNDALLDGLEQRRQHPSFQMSYDGKGCHDWMRGVAGAEEKVLRAFRLLQKRGYTSQCSMTLHKGNADTIRDTVRQLHEVGCSSLKINVASPAGEWLHHPEYYMTQEEAYEAFLNYIPQYFEDGAPITLMLDGAFFFEPGELDFDINFDRHAGERYLKEPICASLRRTVYISPEGLAVPCQSMLASPIIDRYPNVYQSSLREVLSDSVYCDDSGARVSDYMDRNPECSVCEYRDRCCGGCRAVAVIDSGTDYYAPDKKACAFYKDGWYERFFNTARAALKAYPPRTVNENENKQQRRNNDVC